MIPTIQWSDNHICMVDQRKLPHRVQWYTCRSYKDVIKCITNMVIRGAPAIGVAAAMGLALGAESVNVHSYGAFSERFLRMADEMLKARPTAVNLRWAVEIMCKKVEDMIERNIDLHWQSPSGNKVSKAKSVITQLEKSISR